MMKVRPALRLRTVGTSWDHLGKATISQIFISWSHDWIDSIQFTYVEDGGNKIAFSEKIGGGTGSNYMESVSNQSLNFSNLFFWSMQLSFIRFMINCLIYAFINIDKYINKLCMCEMVADHFWLSIRVHYKNKWSLQIWSGIKLSVVYYFPYQQGHIWTIPSNRW